MCGVELSPLRDGESLTCEVPDPQGAFVARSHDNVFVLGVPSGAAGLHSVTLRIGKVPKVHVPSDELMQLLAIPVEHLGEV